MHTAGKHHDRKRKYECNNNNDNEPQRNQNQFAILSDMDQIIEQNSLSKDHTQNPIPPIEKQQIKSKFVTSSSEDDKNMFFQVFGKNVCTLFKQNTFTFTAQLSLLLLFRQSLNFH
jgi:hypothetical protein